MIWRTWVVLAMGAVISAVLCATVFSIYGANKMSKVHTLKFPFLLSGPEQSQNMHLLPKGTTLYFDRAFPEGFSRYKVYINIDRTPLELQELSDPTLIIPIEASAPSKDDLRKLLREYP